MMPYTDHFPRHSPKGNKIILVLALIGLSTLVGIARISTAWADQTLYVNQAHSQASDQNPGSQALPFKTIAQATSVAVANNKNQVGTKILIGAGTYRESISMLKNGQETSAPIAFEALGTVIVSGSDVWGGWQRVTGTECFRSLLALCLGPGGYSGWLDTLRDPSGHRPTGGNGFSEWRVPFSGIVLWRIKNQLFLCG